MSSEPRTPLLSATMLSRPLIPCSFSSLSRSETAASICMSEPISSSSRMIPEKPSSVLTSLMLEAIRGTTRWAKRRSTFTPFLARPTTRDLVSGSPMTTQPDGDTPDSRPVSMSEIIRPPYGFRAST